nr:sulfatase-like hydrolase/transferase [Pedobacter sp. ASV19]
MLDLINSNRLKTYALFVAAALASVPAVAQKKKDSPPNIIFILTDDLGYGDLGVFFQKQRAQANKQNEPWELTPNLDQLAAQGAILPQSYSAAPVCAPSRASILLGVSQGHANVRDNQFDKALEDNYTLANVLKQAGYQTTAIGKWGLQGVNEKPDWPAHPLKRGFDEYFGYIRHSDGHEHYPKEGLYRGKKEIWDNYTEKSKDFDKCYTGDLWTAAAKNWIIKHQNSKKADQPFFMYLAYDTPHAVLELPTQAYPEGGGLKGGLQWLGTPGHMINTASGTIDSWVDPAYANASYEDTYKRYATVVSRIDHQVGDLVQLLKDLHIDSNTIVVFSSDNGPSIESYLPKKYVPFQPSFFGSFGPFDGIKRDCWEGGLRMPVIVSWPKHIPAGSRVNSPNISYDWMPTFAEAAGITAPARTDGVSLMPALLKKKGQKKSLVYVEYFEEGKTPDFKQFAPEHRGRRRNQMQMIRMGDTVGVRYNIQSAQDDFELYDVVNDPGQTKNLAGRLTAGSKLQQVMKDKVLQVRQADASAPRPYDMAFIPATEVKQVVQGIQMESYDGKFSWIPDVSTLKIAEKGVAKVIGNHALNKHPVHIFKGYLHVPADGEYTFYLNADTKAFFRLHEAALIDEDYGYKGAVVKTAKVHLKAGMHPFQLSYLTSAAFKKRNLKLEWEGPSIKRQAIPENTFYRNKI